MPTKKDLEIAERLISLEEFRKQIEEKLKWLYTNSATKQDVGIVASQLNDLETELAEHRSETKKALKEMGDSLTIFTTQTTNFLTKVSGKITLFIGGSVVAGVVFSFVIYLARDILFKLIFG